MDKEVGDCISPICIFTRPKKDGSHSLILNLKDLNVFIQYHHFKMYTFQNVVDIVTENCFMGSLDLRDANYSFRLLKCTENT